MAPTRHVSSTDGVQLAVYESAGTSAHAATVVAVHGYPDNHTVWDGVVAELSGRYRVVTYDVRGSGGSGKPARRAAYRMTQLVDDLAAVLDAVSPDDPVHLLGHDWGSIQLWAAVTDERLIGRIASFTSISGPGLAHVAAWLRAGPRHPRAALRQLAKSWYVLAFQLPALPELLVRSPLMDRLLELGGRPRLGPLTAPERAEAERVNGLQLYRANMLRRGTRRPIPPTSVPVQVLAPRSDAYVSPALQTQAPAPYVARLSTRVIAGGHWVVAHRPDVVARHTAELVERARHESEARPTPSR
jgi:pimeloyl-ACP methyl ester carboxylesterase